MAGKPAKASGAGQPALRRRPLPELIAACEALCAASRAGEAIELYRQWIRHNNLPVTHVALFNLGRLLTDSGDLAAAAAAYRSALARQPAFLQAALNLGFVLERLGQTEEAIAVTEKLRRQLAAAASADVDLRITVHNNLGRMLDSARRFAEAHEVLSESLRLRPEQDAVLIDWIRLRQRLCLWPIYPEMPGIPRQRMVALTSAVATLSLTDDPAVQLDAAAAFVRAKVLADLPRLAPAEGYAHPRLRIGYLSASFNLHAVAILTAELFELHDRARVEVFGYCWSREDGSAMHARVRDGMDHFVAIAGLSDLDAAVLIRAHEIDILVDLQGLTTDCRPNILALRPAPVQITWLGLPATTAMPCIDYVIADDYVLPEALEPYFVEKPLRLPDCFQVNDRRRGAGSAARREDYGLAPDAFVFCVFNNVVKFTPELFAVWMRILARTPGSVLWLLAEHPAAHANIVAAAARSGIDAARIVFAPRVRQAEYLARFRLADLVLDTFPFNGGTTTSDALWMGVPVLSCCGRSFASRMAGSLLHAIGVPELVVDSLAAYEARAVELAGAGHELAELRARIASNRDTRPLFDTPRFVRALEDAYDRVAVRAG